MIYVDMKINCVNIGNRLSLDVDDSLIQVKPLSEGWTDNWGDEDCHKMVTTLTDCDIIIDKSLKDEFKEVENISILRYNYYRPCYHIDHSRSVLTEKEEQPDGTIIYHYRTKA